MEGLTVGQLAKRTGVNIETIRYYERKGLIPAPPRTESGHRRFPDESVARIYFIKQTQGLGFSLKEISELLLLRTKMDASCIDVKARIENKITDVENRIASLLEIKEALRKLASSCPGLGPLDGCPILAALDDKKRRSS